MSRLTDRKTILFAALALTLLVPVVVMSQASAASEFKKKTTFKDEEELNAYKAELANELRKEYTEIKQLKKENPNSADLPKKVQAFEELKAHMAELIKEHDPVANPLPYIEDEMLEMNAQEWEKTNGHYGDISQAQSAPVAASLEQIFAIQTAYAATLAPSVDAKAGYTSQCWWFPLATCDYEPSSYTSVARGASMTLHKLTEANHPWIIPYLKLRHPTIGEYSLVDGVHIAASVTPGDYNSSAGPYQTLQTNWERKFTGPTEYPTSSCGCGGQIPSGTDMSHLFIFG
jgi:hypothetical protein